MPRITEQMKEWMSDFGVEYTRRCFLNFDEEDESFRKKFGITRTKLNNLFIGKLNPAIPQIVNHLFLFDFQECLTLPIFLILLR